MRYRQYLRERYSALMAFVGGIWMIIGLTILVPASLWFAFPDEVWPASAFLLVGLPVLISGSWVWRHFQKDIEELPSPTLHEGMVALVIAWVSAIVIGALPFMLIDRLTVSQAIFEATSGWTTTGLSVVDVEAAPRLLLFYRSLIQMVGGAGFAIIVLSSITGPTGSGLSVAEGRDDLLAPNVRQSAELVLRIYLGYLFVGTAALYFAGMDWFDAINHSFTALSTGGFSTRAESIGYWDSFAVEAVIIALMILGTVNYLSAYLLFRGRWRWFLRNGEVKVLGVLLAFGTALLLLGYTIGAYAGEPSRALRVAVFEVTSAVSTTGFSTVSYLDWPQLGWWVLIIAMIIGGGSGSTAGGLKQFRVYVLAKAVYWEIRRAFLPEHAINRATIYKGEETVLLTDQQVRRAALYVVIYFALFFGGILFLLISGPYDIGAAMFEAASTLSTVGLSVGITSADAPSLQLWLQSLGMLFGRLEFFMLLIGAIKFSQDGWAMFRPLSRDERRHTMEMRTVNEKQLETSIQSAGAEQPLEGKGATSDE